jgi:tRNA U34 5-methylaminomethyl-2-thiouridine-forming methyltransferase MnmC
MKRSLIITKDGSHTVSIPEMNVSYHSLHGAIQESRHVFIDHGLRFFLNINPAADIHVLEMGFGTGLNALLTLIEAGPNLNIHYTAIELYPLTIEEANALNYCEQIKRQDLLPLFEKMHRCEWETDIAINSFFTMHKLMLSLLTIKNSNLTYNNFLSPDIIYFDAFAPAAQPELWTKEVFEILYAILKSKGILVTYCSKGDVRRSMQAAGFVVEKIPGPPGKREIVRALKKT